MPRCRRCRLLARKEGERVTLWTRYGTDFTDRLPRIAEEVRNLPAENALIDGEAVVLRPDGQSDFGALRTKAGGAQACLVPYDLLNLDGEDLRPRPLAKRCPGSGCRERPSARQVAVLHPLPAPVGGSREGWRRAWVRRAFTGTRVPSVS